MFHVLAHQSGVSTYTGGGVSTRTLSGVPFVWGDGELMPAFWHSWKMARYSGLEVSTNLKSSGSVCGHV